MTQNRMTVGRAIISVLALPTVFCGVAADQATYVNEGGWWRRVQRERGADIGCGGCCG